jgi:hypothetical protein
VTAKARRRSLADPGGLELGRIVGQSVQASVS